MTPNPSADAEGIDRMLVAIEWPLGFESGLRPIGSYTLGFDSMRLQSDACLTTYASIDLSVNHDNL